jgi:hypothetical protein
MYLIREVLNCKPGKVGETIRRFKALSDVTERLHSKRFRLLTDLSGEPFWTLVAEMEVEGLDRFREMENEVMAESDAQKAMAGYHELLLGGRREIYRIED